MNEEEFIKAMDLCAMLEQKCDEVEANAAQVCFATCELLVFTSLHCGMLKTDLIRQISQCWDELHREEKEQDNRPKIIIH